MAEHIGAEPNEERTPRRGQIGDLATLGAKRQIHLGEIHHQDVQQLVPRSAGLDLACLEFGEILSGLLEQQKEVENLNAG